MSNSTATVSLKVRGNPLPVAETILAAFQGATEGTIDIADTTAADTEFVVSFGSVAAATMLLIKNTDAQEIYVKLNGSTTKLGLMPGGVLLIAASALPSANTITSAKVCPKANQSGAGTVSYWLVGDPV